MHVIGQSQDKIRDRLSCSDYGDFSFIKEYLKLLEISNDCHKSAAEQLRNSGLKYFHMRKFGTHLWLKCKGL